MSNVIYTPVINNEKSLFYYSSNTIDDQLLADIKDWLEKLEYRDGQCVSGKEIPRKQIWYQKNQKYFCDKWKHRYNRWKSLPDYPTILDSISSNLLNILKPVFDSHNIEIPDINSCLINKYRDGNDSIRAHRDTYLSFGTIPTIIGLSIGEPRILRVRKLHNPELFKSLKVEKESDEHIDFLLEHNSIFVMAGHSQKYFSHEIPKMDTKHERYSLTFREFIE